MRLTRGLTDKAYMDFAWAQEPSDKGPPFMIWLACELEGLYISGFRYLPIDAQVDILEKTRAMFLEALFSGADES